MYKRVCALFLALLFTTGVGTALAADIMPFASTLISYATVTVTVSGNTVTAKANLRCKNVADKLGVQSFVTMKSKTVNG